MRREPDINPAWARAIVWALVLAYIGLFSWLSVMRHQAFRTDAYDMGNVNQAMWNTVAPPGSYSLLVGFYDLTSGERVPLRGGDDSVELHADVEVRSGTRF